MKKPRKHNTGEEKVAILRRHLLEKEPISKLCDEVGLQPTVYRWRGFTGSNLLRCGATRTGIRPERARLRGTPFYGYRRPGYRRQTPAPQSGLSASIR